MTIEAETRPGVVDAVEDTLAGFLGAQIAVLDTVDPELGAFARVTRDVVLRGGKRLRPTFAYWGWRGAGGAADAVEPVLPALGALELLHAFAVVHDDVMDDSATRRGRPAAHRLFAARHGDRFGTAAAILAGDLCLVWADQLLARAGLPAATLLDVRRRYDRMRVQTIAGQYLDVLGESQPAAWSVERALLVARHKTASYTVDGPLDLGLALAGGHRELEAAYLDYGTAVGEAFQLRDDLLGVYGDPAVTGKPAGDDLRTGKPTTLVTLARRLATAAQRRELTTATTVERRAAVIAATGAPARLEQMIDARVDRAVTALAGAPVHPQACAALTELAVTATRRTA